MFSYQIEKSSDYLRVKITGKLTENSETGLQNLAREIAGNPVLINARGISEINSLGAKLWILFMIETSKKSTVEFEECSEILMRYRALIPGMTGSGKIRSVVISYECTDCDRSTEGKIEEKDFSVDDEIKPCPCSACGKPALSKFDPEELFSFLDD